MKTVALDAGHGLYTSGKRCLKSIDQKQTREWTLNNRIMDKVEAKLKSYDVKIVRVDDTLGKVDVTLQSRCAKANKEKADLYISMHHNAGINGGSGGGTVVYCYDKAENKKAANRLYDYIVAQTGLKGNRYTKVDDANFYVIAHTNMKAYLVENGFMDSKIDTPIILTEGHAEKTAVGVTNFIVTELGLKRIKEDVKEESKEEVKSDSFIIRTKVAGLNIRKDAGVEYQITGCIKDKGAYTIVATKKAKDGGTWGKLKSGLGWINISDKFVARV